MRWWMNAGMQYLFAHVPGGRWAHRTLQESRGGLSNIDNCRRFENGLEILELAEKHVGNIENKYIVEVGTGWIPAVPLTFLLAGAKVDTYDVQQLTSPSLFQKTVEKLPSRIEKIATITQQDFDLVRLRHARLGKSNNLEEGMEAFNGRYVITPRTDLLPYSKDSVDLVISNLVLQCVPPTILKEVIIETARILKPGGTAIHRIRMTDEYAPCDPNRNGLSYLQYSDKTWNRFFNHSLKYVNRWRRPQFFDLFKQAGFEVARSALDIDLESENAIAKEKLSIEFTGFSPWELMTVGMTVILRKPQKTLDRTDTSRDDSQQEQLQKQKTMTEKNSQ